MPLERFPGALSDGQPPTPFFPWPPYFSVVSLTFIPLLQFLFTPPSSPLSCGHPEDCTLNGPKFEFFICSMDMSHSPCVAMLAAATRWQYADFRTL